MRFVAIKRAIRAVFFFDQPLRARRGAKRSMPRSLSIVRPGPSIQPKQSASSMMAS
jgi:hypothetical protein